MKTRTISFTEARQRLRRILDEIQRSGRPVTILRRGVPGVVLMSYERFLRTTAHESAGEWRLEGSLRAPKELDVDAALAKLRATGRESLRRRTARHRDAIGKR